MPSFAQLETGREGRPVDLYQFNYGSEIFRFTNVESPVVFSSATYSPLIVKRTAPKINPQDRKSNQVQIEVPATVRPFSDYIGIQPALRLNVTITRVQLDETIVSPEYTSPLPTRAPVTGFILFKGYVSSLAFKGRTATVDLNPFNEQFTREVPRFKYHSLCNNVLYDTQCQVIKGSFSQSGTATIIDGNTVTINGFTGSNFTGGYIENATQTDFRMIIKHTGDVMTLLLPFASVATGETVTCYQGCDHTVQTCKTKFNNVLNFGGYPLIPGVNPFNQSTFVKT